MSGRKSYSHHLTFTLTVRVDSQAPSSCFLSWKFSELRDFKDLNRRTVYSRGSQTLGCRPVLGLWISAARPQIWVSQKTEEKKKNPPVSCLYGAGSRRTQATPPMTEDVPHDWRSPPLLKTPSITEDALITNDTPITPISWMGQRNVSTHRSQCWFLLIMMTVVPKL